MKRAFTISFRKNYNECVKCALIFHLWRDWSKCLKRHYYFIPKGLQWVCEVRHYYFNLEKTKCTKRDYYFIPKGLQWVCEMRHYYFNWEKIKVNIWREITISFQSDYK